MGKKRVLESCEEVHVIVAATIMNVFCWEPLLIYESVQYLSTYSVHSITDMYRAVLMSSEHCVGVMLC